MLTLAIEREKQILAALRQEKNALQYEYDVLSNKVEEWTRVVSNKEQRFYSLDSEIAKAYTLLIGLQTTVKKLDGEFVDKQTTVSELSKTIANAKDSIKKSETEFAGLQERILKDSDVFNSIVEQYRSIKNKLITQEGEYNRKEKEISELISDANKRLDATNNSMKEAGAFRDEVMKYKEALNSYRTRLIVDIEDKEKHGIPINTDIPTFEEFINKK